MFFQMKEKKIHTCQELIHCLTRHIWNFKSTIKPREYFQLNISAKLLDGETWKVLLIIEISKEQFKNIFNWLFVAFFTYDPVTWLFCISQRLFFFFIWNFYFALLLSKSLSHGSPGRVAGKEPVPFPCKNENDKKHLFTLISCCQPFLLMFCCVCVFLSRSHLISRGC